MTAPNSGDGLLRRLLRAERRLHEMAPIEDRYSALVVRSVLWFLLFSLVYRLVTTLL